MSASTMRTHDYSERFYEIIFCVYLPWISVILPATWIVPDILRASSFSQLYPYTLG